MQNLSKNHKEIKNNLINLDVKMFLDVKCLKEHSGEVYLILKFIVWLSGVISISAIRACGAAAFDDGRKKLKFSKNFFFLQIFVKCFK